jgi:hypothetical protein
VGWGSVQPFYRRTWEGEERGGEVGGAQRREARSGQDSGKGAAWLSHWESTAALCVRVGQGRDTGRGKSPAAGPVSGRSWPVGVMS